MSGRIVKFSAAVALSMLMFAWIGCGKKKTADESTGADVTAAPDEVELFAKAQDFQKQEKFEDAVRIYRKIVREYPKTRKAANSQFMIGYIYANHIRDYEQAKIELNRFIDKYGDVADSGLVAGAHFELKYLGKDIDEIPILSDVGKEDTTAPGEEKEAK